MKIAITALALAIPMMANAGTLSGVFQTQPGDTGKFAHVQMAPCASNPALTCGTMIRAYNPDGTPDPTNETVGKLLVWDMADKGNGKYGSGKIWDPTKDKVYKSKMQLNGDALTVEGCIAFICRGQVWQRFQ